MRILVAEDNPENQEIIRRRLERAGHEVLIAANGREAVEMAQSEDPAVVLMDISMPILSGLEATLEIRQIDNVCKKPIIALTAHAMEGDEAKCLAAGCDAFATKPIRFAELNALIEKVISKTAGGAGVAGERFDGAGC
jgi:CheY-like chemotaxis protein